jgi:hypothetical protein
VFTEDGESDDERALPEEQEEEEGGSDGEEGARVEGLDTPDSELSPRDSRWVSEWYSVKRQQLGCWWSDCHVLC